MATQEIQLLPPREIDRLVAERVFGLNPRTVQPRGGDEPVQVWTDNPAIADGMWDRGELRLYGAPREYSTDIADAWLVVEAMKSRGYSFALWDVPGISSVQPGPVAAFRRSTHPPERTRGVKNQWVIGADRAPLAICRAALLAVAGSGCTAEGVGGGE